MTSQTRNVPNPLDEEVKKLAAKCSLESWNSFIEELIVPSELYPALMTNRPELIKNIPGRNMNANEVKCLYQLIGTLIETNAALRQHAQQTAHLVNNWGAAFKQLQTIGGKITMNRKPGTRQWFYVGVLLDVLSFRANMWIAMETT